MIPSFPSLAAVFWVLTLGVIPSFAVDDELNFLIQDLTDSNLRESSLARFNAMPEREKNALRERVVALALDKFSLVRLEQTDFFTLVTELAIPLASHEAQFQRGLKDPALHDK